MTDFVAPFARKLLLLWISLFALALTACSSASPEDVVKNFFEAAAANRVDEAIEYFSLRDVKENDLTAAKGKLQIIVGQTYSNIQKNGGLDSITTTLVEQKEDTARVKVEIKFKNGKSSDQHKNLVKDSGKWKIVLK
ncbi:hypothetical protein AGMMS50225_16810 [Betaproteobacteria bacterium]|nr:hypothetical protein AGMMS50225_16810 [Betaproteobacteria bacterium]